MKRSAVIKKLMAEAKRQGKDSEVVELTNFTPASSSASHRHHTGVIVGGLRSTLGCPGLPWALTARSMM